MKNSILLPINIISAITTATAFTMTPTTHRVLTINSENASNNNKNRRIVKTSRTFLNQSQSPSQEGAGAGAAPPPGDLNKAPTFNGKLTLPIKVVSNGLQNHKVAAVYAILSQKDNGWKNVKYISITRDLNGDLQDLISKYGKEQVKFVRALSFAYPQKAAMGEVANRWSSTVSFEGGTLDGFTEISDTTTDTTTESTERTAEEKEKLIELMMATADFDDDDDDEFEFDDEDGGKSPLFVDATDSFSATATTTATTAATTDAKEEDEVTSPFEMPTYSTATEEEAKLEFNRETVDKVLDEIRPYLISDGGNVSVHSIDEETRSVYLVLEGACGSCASSTVTMQMGIERVLKENFENIGEVAQVEPEALSGGEDADCLTMEAVMKEVNRVSPAITAMGGTIEILSVDPLGVVEVRFRGANKVQQGLELALRDVKYVKHVKFVM